MANAKWKLEFVGVDRMRREMTFHATRELAMKAAYDRLDLAQRDALKLNERDAADAYGRERGHMASAWKAATRSTGTIFNGNFAKVSRYKA
jgi:hypothetical protein